MLTPVFTAEARALAAVLERDDAALAEGAQRTQRVTLMKMALADVLESAARMRRVNNVLGEWLLGGPRPWQEAEEARQPFLEIFDAHVALVAIVLKAAEELGFPAEDLERLRHAQEQLRQLHSHIFERWKPFTRADHDAALEAIQQGKVHDLDEVIRELQGRCN
jgi:hypothetical protein